MNQFSSVLLSYEAMGCEPFREIVTIRLDLYFNGTQMGHIERKFKNGSKRADVNAFHMHRSLCAGLREIFSIRTNLDKAAARQLYSCFASIVKSAYTLNACTNDQYYRFAVNVDITFGVALETTSISVIHINANQDGKPKRILEG